MSKPCLIIQKTPLSARAYGHVRQNCNKQSAHSKPKNKPVWRWWPKKPTPLCLVWSWPWLLFGPPAKKAVMMSAAKATNMTKKQTCCLKTMPIWPLTNITSHKQPSLKSILTNARPHKRVFFMVKQRLRFRRFSLWWPLFIKLIFIKNGDNHATNIRL